MRGTQMHQRYPDGHPQVPVPYTMLAACTKPAYWNGSKCVTPAPSKDADVDAGLYADGASGKKDATGAISDGAVAFNDAKHNADSLVGHTSDAQANGDSTANQLGGGCQLGPTGESDNASDLSGPGLLLLFLLFRLALRRRFHKLLV